MPLVFVSAGMEPQRTTSNTLIFLCALSSLLFTSSLISLYFSDARGTVYSSKPKSYTYTWEDYPLEVPIKLEPTLEVVVEESVHYQVIGPEAHDEWMYDSPHGEGTFRLGPNRHYSTIAMFHQLHCLRIFRGAIAAGPDYPMKLQRQHLEHCLNYLRETTLCAADLTLEPGDFTQRDFDLQRTGATHMCRDYRELYKLSEDDWADWYVYMYRHNISLSELREKQLKEIGELASIT